MSDLDPTLPEPPIHPEPDPTAPPPADVLASADWGPGWPLCRPGDIVRVNGGGVAVNCHRRLATLMGGLLDRTRALGYVLHQDQTGAYVCRPIAGTNSPSNHSRGTAVDLNWRQNGFGPSAPHNLPVEVVRLWKSFGFTWGGDWIIRDWMHMEFTGSQAEADRQTARFAAGDGEMTADERATLAGAERALRALAAAIG